VTQSEKNALIEVLRPNPIEADYTITKIEGEIPRALNGTLYRNGPCQRTLPKAGAEALHFFDGDGLINAIRFDDGKASVRSRFAKTESFKVEQAAGEYVLGGLQVPADAPLEEPIQAVQPNTNVVAHAGRLFALVENAPPFEMNPDTLESMGLWDYDGKMVGMSTTAHPKIDGKTGQMWIHGYQPIEPYIQLYCVEPDGQVSLAEAIDAPWPSMMHDMAITENHVIFPLGSIYFDIDPLAAGKGFGAAIQARPEQNMKFGIRNRAPGSPTRWFDAPSPGYMFHSGNAYERDGRIYMDACTYADPAGLLDGLARVRSGGLPSGLVANPYLYEFDLEAGTCKETKLSDVGAEFPRIDDRLVGHENRWGYAAVSEPASETVEPSVFRQITKYDRTGGPSATRPQVHGQWVGEPVFVPRSPDAEEDDGFVLNLVFDGIDGRTSLDILDARGIDAEPLARLGLEERIPLGFHGNFAQATG
jgi:carotenoid cleavage dioxygenase-like enzyme